MQPRRFFYQDSWFYDFFTPLAGTGGGPDGVDRPGTGGGAGPRPRGGTEGPSPTSGRLGTLKWK